MGCQKMPTRLDWSAGSGFHEAAAAQGYRYPYQVVTSSSLMLQETSSDDAQIEYGDVTLVTTSGKTCRM